MAQKTHPKKLQNSAKSGLKQGEKQTHSIQSTNIWGVSDVKFCAESRSWNVIKNAPKKLPKTAKIRQKHEKKMLCPYKSSNLLGDSYAKSCAKSNGTTPGLENWCNDKICPKNLIQKGPRWAKTKKRLYHPNK